MTIQEICESFDVGGKYVGCKELTTGNINSTYHVRFIRDGEDKNYIVQRINTEVFKNPEKLMDNIVRVTEYIHENIVKEGLSTKRFVLKVFPTIKDHKMYLVDDKGGYWRCYRYISNSMTYDSCQDLQIIERVGAAFGKFQKTIDGFDAKSLYEVIPNFHNTPKRYEAFREVIEKDPCKRVESVKGEIDRILAFSEQASVIQSALSSGKLPTRVTHNDTKCNNVSFDKTTGEALAVLDLDTVMSGAIAYDFGDAIRSIASTLIEDDPDIDNVALDMDKYYAFMKGFVGQVKDGLTDYEVETLNLGVFTMTIELAVRFMADYIAGDVYFKVKYPGHNLDRAKNQLALAEDIYKKLGQMDQMLFEFIRR